MIHKMALLCWRIPWITALSDLQKDLNRAFYNHFIKHTTIDSFLGFLCAGTVDLVCEFSPQTPNALWPFGRLRPMPQARRPRTSALDALDCPSPECIMRLVWQGKHKCHLQINHQGLPLPRASHQQSHLPRHQLYSTHQQSPTESPEPDSSIPAPADDQIPEESI